jgi:L,D-transpeptidase YcbB
MKSNTTFWTSFALAAIWVLTFGCSHSISQAPVLIPDTAIAPRRITMPSDSMDAVYLGLHAARAVFKLYSNRQYELLWTDDSAKVTTRDSLVRFIRQSRYYGLKSRWYHMKEIDAINGSATHRNAQRLDALLTDAFLSIRHDLNVGRTGPPVEVEATTLDSLSQLNSLQAYFDALEPSHSGYQDLKNALGFKLDSLRIADPLFDPDNTIIPSTAIHDKIEILRINMERWRLERSAFAKHKIFINIPSYVLKVLQDDSVVFESRIIVGATDWQTPELNGIVDCIVTFPYWYVPRKIAVKEYLPAIRRDTSFLRRNQFDLLNRKGLILRPDSIPWEDFDEDYFPVTLRQREGSENSLGVLKFIFDNPFAIFLHDTNAKKLFRKKDRALSHGCIRVDKANKLAHYLITGSPNRRSVLLDNFLNAKERHSISIPTPVPIYIRYFTCEAMKDGVLFLEDIYKKDQALIDAFNHVAIERL